MVNRAVILSSNYALKLLLSNELKKISQLEVADNVLDIARANALLLPGAKNIWILDIESHRVTDAFLTTLLTRYNLKIIVIGQLNASNFIRCGITDIVSKPLSNNSFSETLFLEDIAKRCCLYLGNSDALPKSSSGFSSFSGGVDARQKIIAIAASTGGTEALPAVLSKLPANIAPILIVQHMPSGFTKQFAQRLDQLSLFKVKEAQNGDFLQKELALLAPGDFHMKMVQKPQGLGVECFMAEKMHGVRPAAEILFQSMVPIMGANVIGVILTGMGADGARGLLELRQKGAKIIGQDEKSCVVYGMPKVAFDIGAVEFQVPLEGVAQKIISLL